MDRIQKLKGEIEELTYIHIYTEFNHRADNLSKQAITVQEGVLIEQVTKDNTTLPAVQKLLF